MGEAAAALGLLLEDLDARLEEAHVAAWQLGTSLEAAARAAAPRARARAKAGAGKGEGARREPRAATAVPPW